ncbi:unnamed protein product [Protopolystoma xenopodis]|uniref:Uncharacterized protein n=1 Tax=Protopolystoma xenopodis TaxID=117903 RepID=A0A3S5FDR1_9PLAT|nr:unnamed protein product [Protopolystoma xenopodis]
MSKNLTIGQAIIATGGSSVLESHPADADISSSPLLVTNSATSTGLVELASSAKEKEDSVSDSTQVSKLQLACIGASCSVAALRQFLMRLTCLEARSDEVCSKLLTPLFI